MYNKFGNAIGSAVGIMIMAAFGYAANQEQTQEALRGINITVNLLPAVLLVVAAVMLRFLWNKSDADFDAIRERNRK